MVIIGRLINILGLEKDALVQWNTQVGNITTDIKVEIYFTLSTINANNFVTWNFHVEDSANGMYNMILGRDTLT